MIETVVGVDSGNKAMIFRVVGDNLQFVVAAIAQCGPYHLTAVFLSFPVEREHHLSVRSMRVARAVGILYNLLTGCQRLLVDLPFVSPRAIERAHPYVATTDGQCGRIEIGERDGAFLAVGDISPRFNHVDIIICLVVDVDGEGILWVSGVDSGDGRFAVGCNVVAGGKELRCHIPVGMATCKSGLSRRHRSVGKINLVSRKTSGRFQVGHIRS